jgi:hypothetical protein
MTTRIIPITLDVTGRNGIHRQARLEFAPHAAGVELKIWQTPTAQYPFAIVQLSPDAFVALGAPVATPGIEWARTIEQERPRDARTVKGAHVEPKKSGGFLVVICYDDAAIETETCPTRGEAEDRARVINDHVQGGDR